MADRIEVPPTGPCAVAALADGEPVLVVDPVADVALLVLAGRTADTGSVGRMIRMTCGFLCAAMPATTVRRLRIPMSPVDERGEDDGTRFGISVDAVGTGTGISAGARATTFRALADPGSRPESIVRPGHVMTVQVADGARGRVAHAVELVRRAGMEPVAAYGHLVSSSDPRRLAGVEEALFVARTARLATSRVPAGIEPVIAGRSVLTVMDTAHARAGQPRRTGLGGDPRAAPSRAHRPGLSRRVVERSLTGTAERDRSHRRTMPDPSPVDRVP
ncbi:MULTISPECIES: 3,4-dihydroxy-2-butanone-4-phosphate synthase [Pseudonocardia]|uniref:3,4-dihydroxy-2-butanone-4-phosphate synthase n=2 Tax=Pseudonocardia TaxID=1847 RepID=A0A1Y2MLT1_PSEAH|nr:MULTISPECIES: 3,4-dihydroxy-2-butanone-4-phosphate synthase [Pseudonocardia]OSY35607.1 Riboflavin biosynthesis protein RibBA [Pseudonocardia autotrophica]TDN76898.1 3,4-dihydroxy-2-butanone 4-phosphate synthase [Pseudonocardia autotrophica]BBG00901.1 hypothetical protein Pdca_21100 [Pseudonocardia autotrophica]GEC27540.1 hypothetical protein PSA01_45690 [Pseudonocardia saturnea]